MARSRNIKPAFFDNSELGALNSDIRLLFIALWQLADREGILEYNPSVIRRYAFGYRSEITENDINGYITVISQLDNGDTLSIRKLGNKQYIIITNFARHQNPHHTEKKGKLPELKSLINSDLCDITVTQRLSNGENPADSCFLIPDSIIKNITKKPKVKVDDPNFKEFWKLYPRKRDERAAQIQYAAVIKSGITHEQLMGCLGKYLLTGEVQSKCIFNPKKWLAEGHWKEHMSNLSVAEDLPEGVFRRSDGKLFMRNEGSMSTPYFPPKPSQPNQPVLF